ncbi:histone-lysine N-methyltransferase [Forsythia ovata]|uniref:Histone-lysine N-methyltransferase n=1 Tax=Forsythia ovata TaxID=205694 RepID=A0ABD1W529_9LAMI
MISCGKDCVDGIKKFEVETDVTQTLRKNLESGALMEMPIVSQTESLDGVEKVEVRTEAIGTGGENVRKHPLLWRHKFKAVAKRSKIKREISGGPSIKKKAIPIPSGNSGALILRDEKRYGAHDENLPSNSHASYTPHDFDVSIPPKHSSHTDARNRVIETLRLFRSICRKCSQDEAKSKNQTKRIDLFAVEIIKERKMEVNTGKKILGEVPGVEVGDEFQYRVELAIVGIHRPYQAGIDSMKHNGISVANSIVDAGVYAGDKHNADVIIYSGQGGNIVGKNKPPEDQKLKKGNLALKNSISAKNSRSCYPTTERNKAFRASELDVPSYYVPTHASADKAQSKVMRAPIERSTSSRSSILKHVLIAGSGSRNRLKDKGGVQVCLVFSGVISYDEAGAI